MDFYRKTDRLAVTKLVSKLTRSSLKSPYAACMLIRIACKLIEEEDATGQLISKEIFFDTNCSKKNNNENFSQNLSWPAVHEGWKISEGVWCFQFVPILRKKNQITIPKCFNLKGNL